MGLGLLQWPAAVRLLSLPSSMPFPRLTGTAWRVRATTEKRWLPAIVPGCVRTDLLSAGVIDMPVYAENERALQWIERGLGIAYAFLRGAGFSRRGSRGVTGFQIAG
jgi:hypothetical protein